MLDKQIPQICKDYYPSCMELLNMHEIHCLGNRTIILLLLQMSAIASATPSNILVHRSYTLVLIIQSIVKHALSLGILYPLKIDMLGQ